MYSVHTKWPSTEGVSFGPVQSVLAVDVCSEQAGEQGTCSTCGSQSTASSYYVAMTNTPANMD